MRWLFSSGRPIRGLHLTSVHVDSFWRPLRMSSGGAILYYCLRLLNNVAVAELLQGRLAPTGGGEGGGGGQPPCGRLQRRSLWSIVIMYSRGPHLTKLFDRVGDIYCFIYMWRNNGFVTSVAIQLYRAMEVFIQHTVMVHTVNMDIVQHTVVYQYRQFSYKCSNKLILNFVKNWSRLH